MLILLVLLLAGCRGADRVAAPSAEADRPSAATDPLADIEATLDAVERDVDADAGAAGR